MRDNRRSGSEGGARSIPCPYPYPTATSEFGFSRSGTSPLGHGPGGSQRRSWLASLWRAMSIPAHPMPRHWKRLRALALDEIEATLAELPAPLREEARKLPITFEHLPSRELQADGIAPDTLGLFVGPEFADRDVSASPLPSQIILYLDNLWDFAEADEDIFCEEVHTTLLHELGHYLGLDEDELVDRGLE